MFEGKTLPHSPGLSGVRPLTGHNDNSCNELHMNNGVRSTWPAFTSGTREGGKPRSLSGKQSVRLCRPELPYGRCQTIPLFPAFLRAAESGTVSNASPWEGLAAHADYGAASGCIQRRCALALASQTASSNGSPKRAISSRTCAAAASPSGVPPGPLSRGWGRRSRSVSTR